MAHFPQLESGCTGQYPLRRTLRLRTLQSETPDGRRKAAFDGAGSSVWWDLTLTGLSESEADAIQELFRASEGRRRSFVFVDPSANLLGGTDDFIGTWWDKGPGAVVEGGRNGPEGHEAFSITNLGAAWNGVSQSPALPASMNFCLSVWVRFAAEGSVRLSIGEVARTVKVENSWQQVWVSGTALTSPVRFTIAVPPGETAEIYGPQAEAQIAPSEYKRNRGRGGWYQKARFGSDALTFRSEAPGVYGCDVRIVSPWEE